MEGRVVVITLLRQKDEVIDGQRRIVFQQIDVDRADIGAENGAIIDTGLHDLVWLREIARGRIWRRYGARADGCRRLCVSGGCFGGRRILRIGDLRQQYHQTRQEKTPPVGLYYSLYLKGRIYS